MKVKKYFLGKKFENVLVDHEKGILYFNENCAEQKNLLQIV